MQGLQLVEGRNARSPICGSALHVLCLISGAVTYCLVLYLGSSDRSASNGFILLCFILDCLIEMQVIREVID